ncbi:MAG TPA: hypothetical protein VJM15_09890 [Sphingomicrobium sp.]|nr:hypothetical protein [Sphingomicrobium sp.]
MLLLLAVAAAVSAPPEPAREPVASRVQARATVRVISGAVLRLGSAESRDGYITRDSVIQTGGETRRARLIEFE